MDSHRLEDSVKIRTLGVLRTILDCFRLRSGTSGRTRTVTLAFFILYQIYKNPFKTPILGTLIFFSILQILSNISVF